MIKSRLEAFSDGVIAIIITIMILEIKPPESTDWHSLLELLPKFLSYILSFAYVGIYWNNHHHMFQAVKKGVKGNILWSNLTLLFWLSLIPVATAWMGEHNFEKNPVILYGFVLLMNAISYWILANLIIKNEGKDSHLAKAIGNDIKGKLSMVFYILGIIFSFFHSGLGILLYAIVALMWLIPDKRIEKLYKE